MQIFTHTHQLLQQVINATIALFILMNAIAVRFYYISYLQFRAKN